MPKAICFLAGWLSLEKLGLYFEQAKQNLSLRK
jgi:hypothetical protein